MQDFDLLEMIWVGAQHAVPLRIQSGIEVAGEYKIRPYTL